MTSTLLEALRCRLARAGREVVLHETHLSWVLLSGRLAIKLKKPVQLPFVDFSTPEARRAACAQELRLNRRIAPTLYRALVAVRGTPGAPRLAGPGDAIDTLVCMHRFSEDALLSRRLAAGTLDARTVDSLATRIARFHEGAEQAPEVGDAVDEATASLAHVLDQLAAFESPAWQDQAACWLQGSRDRLAPAFRARRARGMVRDCHGDLHLANTVDLGTEVTAFDCIEFDPALRRIDVVHDIAFATMDLAVRGRPDLAHRFLDAYLAARGDYGGLSVLRFYETSRACVRRLVQHLSPGTDGDAPDYLGFATRRMSAAPGRPRLALLCGVAGSGKSVVAAALVEATGAVRVRSDVERKRLRGLDALARSACGDGLYDAQATAATYARLAECARSALTAGYDVLVDATFLRRMQRASFAALAGQLQVPFTILACEAPAPELVRRVAARAAAGADPSEADVAVLERQLKTREGLADAERPWTIDVDTTTPVDIARLVDDWRRRAAMAADTGSLRR
jgi:aminoglycoside phosphotransferase family enzyme/predicted kinase